MELPTTLPASRPIRRSVPLTFGGGAVLISDELFPTPSKCLHELRRKVRILASCSLPVLIEGESGAGKEVIASAIHQLSTVSDGPFVKIACAAVPAPLFESELFGYEAGAFTGARVSKPGRVSLAHNGTLFLDEVGELEVSVQPKLLQLLQEGEFCSIGGDQPKHVTFRLVSATSRDLPHEVAEGRFREDLFFRINVTRLRVPSMREYAADIPRLCSYFVEYLSRQLAREVKPLSDRTVKELQRYFWPGNLRQLENLIRRYVILGSEDALFEELDVQPKNGNNANWPEIPLDGSVSLKQATRDLVTRFQSEAILRALKANHGSRTRAARALGLSYRTLLSKLKEIKGTLSL